MIPPHVCLLFELQQSLQAVAEADIAVPMAAGGGHEAAAVAGIVPCSEHHGLAAVAGIMDQLTITGRPKRIPGGNPMDVNPSPLPP